MFSKLGLLVVTEGVVSHDDGSYGIDRMLRAFDDGIDGFLVDRVHLRADRSYSLRDAIEGGNYDQIWLFGGSSPGTGGSNVLAPRALRDDEREALREFMDGGGGIFATGDHAAVGAPLCARIPRVRYMRSWGLGGALFAGTTPPKYRGQRADTVFASGLTGKPDSETDAFGKPVWVKHRSIYEPHALFAVDAFGGAIRWLPDHVHEGECFGELAVPSDLAPADQVEVGEMCRQFPGDVRPEVIAWSVRRGFSNAPGNIEDRPSVHGVVSCYDGFRAGVGRIVVDSTFHHWTGGNTRAMLASPIGRELLRYPRNIAAWLSPGVNGAAGRAVSRPVARPVAVMQ